MRAPAPVLAKAGAGGVMSKEDKLDSIYDLIGRRIERSARAHARCVELLRRQDRWLAGASLIASVLAAALCVALVLQRSDPLWALILALGLGATLGAIVALQCAHLLLRPAEGLAHHRNWTADYEMLAARLQVMRVRDPLDLQELERILLDMARLARTAGYVNRGAWRRAKVEQKYRVRPANGLPKAYHANSSVVL